MGPGIRKKTGSEGSSLSRKGPGDVGWCLLIRKLLLGTGCVDRSTGSRISSLTHSTKAATRLAWRRTEIASLAGEQQQILMVTMGAADPGETMTKDPTLQKASDRSLHHCPQGTVVFLIEVRVALSELLPVAFQALVETALFGVSVSIGARQDHHLPITFPPSESAKSCVSGWSD